MKAIIENDNLIIKIEHKEEYQDLKDWYLTNVISRHGFNGDKVQFDFIPDEENKLNIQIETKKFIDKKQDEHFNKYGVYADTNSKIAEWIAEFVS
jgi:hypothetical protein